VVKARPLALTEATRADELMVTTIVYDHAARRRSYELWRKHSIYLPQADIPPLTD
jgi:hypothetical protein